MTEEPILPPGSRLSLIERVPGEYKWLCLCTCGTVKAYYTSAIKSGDTKSCGCLRRDFVSATKGKHRLSRSPEYAVWSSMQSRCYWKKQRYYHRYGGRGITVCDRWLGTDGFQNFYSDMGPRPSPTHSLDRTNYNGNYEPGNCQWATWKQQNRNKSSNRLLTFAGKTATISEWSEITGINQDIITRRLSVKWSVAETLVTPTCWRRSWNSTIFY